RRGAGPQGSLGPPARCARPHRGLPPRPGRPPAGVGPHRDVLLVRPAQRRALGRARDQRHVPLDALWRPSGAFWVRAEMEEPSGQRSAAMAIDEAKLEAVMGKVVTELGAGLGFPLHRLGDQLGIWKAMAGAGPLTVSEVAERSGCHERYIKEWLAAESAGGYIDYDAATETFSLSDEVAFAMADESSPVFLGGAWQVATSIFESLPKLAEAYSTGTGVAWGDHTHNLFEGVERFFRPGYNANLVSAWLPALDGVVEKLERGAKVADIGCGH